MPFSRQNGKRISGNPPFVPVENGFTSHACFAKSPPVMDKFWSIFTMPIGVAMCFGPAMIVWWLTDRKKKKD